MSGEQKSGESKSGESKVQIPQFRQASAKALAEGKTTGYISRSVRPPSRGARHARWGRYLTSGKVKKMNEKRIFMVPIDHKIGRIPSVIKTIIVFIGELEKKIQCDPLKSIHIAAQQFCQRRATEKFKDNSFNLWLPPVEVWIRFHFSHDFRHVTNMSEWPVTHRFCPEIPLPKLFRINIVSRHHFTFPYSLPGGPNRATHQNVHPRFSCPLLVLPILPIPGQHLP